MKNLKIIGSRVLALFFIIIIYFSAAAAAATAAVKSVIAPFSHTHP
jgi:hypothetical protein